MPETTSVAMVITPDILNEVEKVREARYAPPLNTTDFQTPFLFIAFQVEHAFSIL